MSPPKSISDESTRAADTWLLTGIPRSGSSFACRLVGDLPDVVALSEPIPRPALAGLATSDGACARIRGFAADARRLVSRERRAPSLHVDGRLDDNVVAHDSDDGLRRRQAVQGEIAIDKPLTTAFTLLIKHNALFAALLPELTASFPCVALVRNPLVVLASWQTVDLPVNRGRIPAGEQFDRDLAGTLDRAPDLLGRQVAILNWFFTRYADNLAVDRIVRYEELISTGGGALFGVLGHTDASTRQLASRNANAIYRGVDVGELLAALVNVGGAWTAFYSPADCEAAAARLARVARPS